MSGVGGASALRRIDRRTWRLCWVIVLGAFASGLDASIVNVGLASISASLGASLETTQWAVSGYLVAMAVSLPAAGWLGKRIGSGRLWLAALAAFTVASVLCALAPTVGLLIAARVLQGLAGGLLIPTGQTILGQAVGPDRLGRVMGALGVAVSAAPAIGACLGGMLVDALDWPWLFLANVPIGLVGLVVGRRLIPRGDADPTKPLHLPGLALVAIGLPALVYAASRIGEAGTVTVDAAVIGGLAVAALLTFVPVSLRETHPVVDLALYRIAGFRAGAVTAMFSGALIFGSGVLFALYFQVVRGQTPLTAGFSLIGLAAGTALAAPATGWWVDRVGPGPVGVGGGGLALVTSSSLVFIGPGAPMLLVQALLVAFGVSLSLVAMPAGIAAYRSVSETELPDAVTQVNIVQRVGGALGGALCAVLIAGPADPADGFRSAMLALVAATFGAAAGAVQILRVQRRQEKPSGSGARPVRARSTG